MKPFTFRLESVLAIRAREEEQARELYARVLQARTLIEAALQQARNDLEGYHRALATKREGRSRRDEQLVFLSALQYQQAYCEKMRGQLAIAERDVEARRGELLVAHSKHEALVRLKDRQGEAHETASQRAEEMALGDLITARHALATFGAMP